MKQSILLILGLFLCQQLAAQQELLIDKVVATVGGEYILYSEVINGYRYQLERNPDLPKTAICSLTEQLVAQKILVDQAKLDSIEVGAAELEGQLDYRLDNILRMMNGDESRFEDHYGKTLLAVKQEMRESLKQQMLAEKIQRKLINTVSITPKEVVKFYNSIPADSMPYLNAEVELSEIIMKPKVNDVESKAAIEKLQEIRDKIVSGEETFAEMASKFSADGSGQTGGNLGWAKRGSYVPEFEAIAYGLKQGELSEIVETEFGYHIIELIQRRGNSINVKHILIRPRITQADLDIAKAELDSIKHLIVSDSITFERAVKLYSDKKSQSYNNAGRMVNPGTGESFFETKDLPTDIYFEIEELDTDQISSPIEAYDPRGDSYYRLVKLLSKTKPHRASLDQDYSRIQNFAKESKKNEYFNNWMKDKMESTFIEFDKDLAYCPNLLKWIDDESAQDKGEE